MESGRPTTTEPRADRAGGSRALRLDRALQANLPLPLARLYARAHHAKGDRERHDHAFHLVETAIKLAAAAAIARYRGCGVRSEKVDLALRGLSLPSLGQWRDILRESLRFLGARPGADAWSRGILERASAPGSEDLRETFRTLKRCAGHEGREPAAPCALDLLDLLPTYRNAMSDAHGAIKTDTSLYRDGTLALLDAARELLEGADVLGGGRLVFAEEVRSVRAGELEALWMDLTGPLAIRRHPPEAIAEGSEVRPGQVYLELSATERLALHPLLYYRLGDLLDEVFFLNRARGGRGGTQFLCYETGGFWLPGREPEGEMLQRDLGRLLTWIVEGQPEIRPAGAEGEAGAAAVEGADRPEIEAAEAPDEPAAGHRTLGDFEILGELGRGGMSVVYLALQRSLGRKVALKVLPPALRDDPAAVARFRQEVRALARCDHPNVVKILTSGVTDGTYWYAMEHIDGADLADIARVLREYRAGGSGSLRESHFSVAATTAGRFLEGDPARGLPKIEKVPAREIPRLVGGRDISFRIASVIRDAARGVQHIHDQGIVHRDLKPQNIMVLRDSQQPVVMDLGLAKMAGASQSLSLARGGLLGTLRYMAPEQLQRNLLEVDARADVYSLGAVLYELASLRPMLDGDTEERLTKQILFESPPPPQKANPRIPGDLATIIEKATRKDPRERYASASELADDLERFVHGEAIAARAPSVGYLLRVWIQRHAAMIAAPALAVALVVGTFLGLGWYRATRDFRENLEEGRAAWRAYLETKRDLATLGERWREAETRHETWQPVWERADEVEAWRALEAARRDVEYRFNDALLAFHRARNVGGIGASRRLLAETAIEDAYWDRLEEAEAAGGVRLPPEFFQLMIRSIGSPRRAGELEGRRWVALRSDPPGAGVWCFRHENVEEHLLPLPFDPAAGREDPAAGLRGGPFLRVERVWRDGEGAAQPFRPGDRIDSVKGMAVGTRGQLARALSGVAPGEEIVATAIRDDRSESLPWIPFPVAAESPTPAGGGEFGSLAPGRLVSERQLGVTFEGYPLETLAERRLGVTREGEDLRIELPRGSYVLVLEKEGYEPARLPVSVPQLGDVSETVRLRRSGELPPGFVLVTAGPFQAGGDPEADQSLELRTARVPDFAMARHEVTNAEYLEFLNAPEVLSATDLASGQCAPISDWSELEGRGLLPDERRCQLVPSRGRSGLLFRPEGDPPRWAADRDLGARGLLEPGGPVQGVSMLAGFEYARWLTRRHGGKWRFRLPTDLEWERAARGASRRVHVWGDYPAWCFCRSKKGILGESKAGPVGAYPLDESIFRVRDLAGSVSEPTIDRTTLRFRYISIRGGSYYTTEDRYFRISNRNGRLPEGSGIDTGLRLVAELP